jgi:hypothetical protein
MGHPMVILPLKKNQKIPTSWYFFRFFCPLPLRQNQTNYDY